MAYELTTLAQLNAVEDAMHTPRTYLGNVGTRCMMPDSALTGANRWMGGSSAFYLRADAPDGLWLVYSNVALLGSNNAETTYGAGTIKCSIWRPRDGAVAANVEGEVAFPVGHKALFVPGNFKKGDLLSYLQKNSNACLYKQPQSYWILSDFDGWESGTGTVVDRIGTTTPYAKNVIFCPLTMVLAATTLESVAVVGDSIEDGGPDTVADNSLDVGLIAHTIGRDIGYLKLTRSGTLLQDWLSADRTYRDQLLTGNVPGLPANTPYFTAIINAYGINDANAGRSGVDIAADRATFAALYNSKVPVYGRTLLPVNSSSDGASSISGQSDTSASPRVREFNKLERLGISGETGYWDAAAYSDPLLRDLWPPSPDPSVSTYPNTVTGALGYITPAPTNVTGTFTNGSTSVTVSSAAALVVGQMISIPIPGLKFGTRITAIVGSTLTLSNAFTGTTTAGVAMTFDGAQLTITTAPTAGTFVVGDSLVLNGGASPAQPGTTIVAFGTATGSSTGTMCVNFSGRLREAVGSVGTPVTIRSGGYATIDLLHATTKHAENIARRGKASMTAMLRR